MACFTEAAITHDLRPRLSASARGAGLSTDELVRIHEAMDLSFEVHRPEKSRPDGTPYVDHPLSVALSLFSPDAIPDADLAVAALLHDSVENHPADTSHSHHATPMSD